MTRQISLSATCICISLVKRLFKCFTLPPFYRIVVRFLFILDIVLYQVGVLQITFFPAGGLTFHALSSVFQITEVFHFNEVQFYQLFSL